MRVTALIDESDLSAAISDYTAWIATSLDWKVDLVHVNEDIHTTLRPERTALLGIAASEQLFADVVANDEQAYREARERGYELLQVSAERLHEAGVANPQRHVVTGTLIDHLAAHHKESGLFVMGKRGSSGKQGTHHIGSHVERVIRATHRPLLVVMGPYKPVRQVVFAWDGSKCCGAAIEFLVETGLLRGASGQIIYVGDEYDRVSEWFDTAASHLQSGGISLEPVRLTGNPAHTIVDVLNSDEPDLLVMGAYGHSRLRSLVLGSTTSHVLGQSQVSTLVFH